MSYGWHSPLTVPSGCPCDRFMACSAPTQGFQSLAALLALLLGACQPTTPTETVALQPGAAWSRTIAHGQPHRFRFDLAADQFLHLSVEQQGIDGTGTIRQLAENGTYINMRPVSQFHLTVEVPGQQPYDVAVSEAVAPHAFAQLQVGARIPVKVMPDDPNQVQIRWGMAA